MFHSQINREGNKTAIKTELFKAESFDRKGLLKVNSQKPGNEL